MDATVWGLASGDSSPLMENQMKKSMELEVGTRFSEGASQEC